jgi:dephospho-CoA kinase
MKKIAITGTIASGKTQAAAWLRAGGWPVFDADNSARACLDKSHPAYARIVQEFSADILDEDGRIDRSRLAAAVFGKEAERKRLNAIVHPYVKEELHRFLASCRSRLAFAEVPLLFEAGWEQEFDEIAVIVCSEENAVRRCMHDRGYTRAQALARIQAQMPAAEQIVRASKVFYNDTDIRILYDQLADWVQELEKD